MNTRIAAPRYGQPAACMSWRSRGPVMASCPNVRFLLGEKKIESIAKIEARRIYPSSHWLIKPFKPRRKPASARHIFGGRPVAKDVKRQDPSRYQSDHFFILFFTSIPTCHCRSTRTLAEPGLVWAFSVKRAVSVRSGARAIGNPPGLERSILVG